MGLPALWGQGGSRAPSRDVFHFAAATTSSSGPAVAGLDPPDRFVGLGMSFPVGYWLGIALLCAKGSSVQNGPTLRDPGPAS
ncbi:MAG: hypothetical protein DLM73_00950 [Chthoniobacterales bacterium]|nr:MAG: hypothetical protein DLM73_00950 [Chthoniobacterales bacterium]